MDIRQILEDRLRKQSLTNSEVELVKNLHTDIPKSYIFLLPKNAGKRPNIFLEIIIKHDILKTLDFVPIVKRISDFEASDHRFFLFAFERLDFMEELPFLRTEVFRKAFVPLETKLRENLNPLVEIRLDRKNNRLDIRRPFGFELTRCDINKVFQNIFDFESKTYCLDTITFSQIDYLELATGDPYHTKKEK